jgi:hypothetical protein
MIDSFDDEWRDYRRDDSRMGAQPLARKSGKLEQQWSIRLGGSFQEVELIPDGSGDILMADAGGIQRVSSYGTFRWRTKPFGALKFSRVTDAK